jgi:Tfp pilus assembly protein PilF
LQALAWGARSYGYSRLEAALGWLRSGDVAEAEREVVEALEFLRTDTSRLIIAEDTAAHDHAIRVLEGIGWD